MNRDAKNGWLDREGLGAGVLLYIFRGCEILGDTSYGRLLMTTQQ